MNELGAVASRRASFIRRQCALLANSSELSVEAVGIGGSVGAFADDSYSDIDIFILLSSGSVHDIFTIFPGILRGQPEKRLGIDGPDFLQGFGFRYRCIFQEFGKVEYFVQTRETFTPSAGVMRTRVLVDATGWFSEQVEGVRVSGGLPWIDGAVSEWICAALDLRKSVARMQYSSASFALERARTLVYSVELTRINNEPFSLIGNRSHAERILPHDVVSYIQMPSGQAPNSVFDFVVDWLALREALLAGGGLYLDQDPAVAAYESDLVQSLRALLGAGPTT